ncbi:cysteine-rich CWC family protein [Aquabacterium sp.]|uniref:cysteine-rich CWC family protein n=1 Tax=Aquabacterium sp. TaxID=1872578 RepID=UPI0035AF349D
MGLHSVNRNGCETMNTPHPPDDGICPSCGRGNQCGMATPSSEAAGFDCWCMHTEISPTVLASLPATERGLRCLCPSCAQGTPPVHNGK